MIEVKKTEFCKLNNFTVIFNIFLLSCLLVLLKINDFFLNYLNEYS